MSVSAAPQLAWPVARAQTTQDRLSSRADVLLAAFTLGRLCLIPVIVLSFMTEPVVSSAAIVLFVLADVYDGVIARRYHADGPERRALDSIVDRIGIDVCLVGAYFAGALPAVLVGALLARDAYCAVLCAGMFRERNVAIKADWLYRALNLSVAACALAAPFVSATERVAVGGVLFVAAVLVALDLTRAVRLVRRSPSQVRDTVIPAARLRRRHSFHEQLLGS